MRTMGINILINNIIMGKRLGKKEKFMLLGMLSRACVLRATGECISMLTLLQQGQQSQNQRANVCTYSEGALVVMLVVMLVIIQVHLL